MIKNLNEAIAYLAKNTYDETHDVRAFLKRLGNYLYEVDDVLSEFLKDCTPEEAATSFPEFIQIAERLRRYIK